MPRIEQHIFSENGLEDMLRDAIRGRLGDDRDALKEINVDVIRASTINEARMLDRDFPKGLFQIKGLLALDDSGVGMKYFNFNMEQGLSKDKDQEVADQLAFQCYACVEKMKREHKENPDKYKLVLA